MTTTVEMPAGGAVADQAAQTDARQFVTFSVGNEVFAVPMAPVREIIRVPDVVRVPLSPPSLEGLANLRGLVLPVISLRQLFRFPEREYDDATRALVIDFGSPAGFVVDRVASVITVELDQIENAAAIQGTIDSDLLLGVIKNVGGHEMVMILDFARLIKTEFATLERHAAQSTATVAQGAAVQTGLNTVGDSSDELQLVSFEVAGQEYAVAIERVQEIVQVPEQIIHVPKSASHVLGVITLRQRLLPLVSLRRMFELPMEALSEHNRIVVVSLSGADHLTVGVVTDTVNEVLRVNNRIVEPMPALLARHEDVAEITDICRLNDGKRLVSIISAEKMFAHRAFHEAAAVVNELRKEHEEAEQAVETTQNVVGEDEQMVVFRLVKEEFGVPIESVQEIVRVPEQLTHVPKAPSFIEGVINLRGTVLPVIDQRRRFGLPSMERNDRQRIMVFTINGVHTGFIVDSVSEVLKIPHQAIEEAPHLSDETSRLIRRVANLQKQKRMILLLDIDKLLEGGEMKALKQALQ
ncbi:MAG: chemotaxis protein CheW [Gammaproteobacteria bacterium]|nr:chemotaxis protein CheW [Gammaproteobacteria bacterium]MCP5195349.1 chemotaxis protein CheW [Gammaproteobacteria bacterium]